MLRFSFSEMVGDIPKKMLGSIISSSLLSHFLRIYMHGDTF
uniref:Uncharacterized protein n=1 Tax=Arundo donax TaxID=35708 RepID=A0A0A9H0C0_ARUDO